MLVQAQEEPWTSGCCRAATRGRSVGSMTPTPQDEAKDRTVAEGAPLDDPDAARHLTHLGMSPDAAKAYAAYHSGRYADFHRDE